MLGYVFNPLTVYWCHRADGTLACVVAEVHNTYGQRHAYLLHTDDRGRVRVPKQFYVSPFYPVDGRYRMSLPEPDARLALSVVLDRPDGHSFAASVHGRGVPATARALIGAAARHPWSTAAVSARIRWQGMKLYLRGLRPVPAARSSTPGGGSVTSTSTQHAAARDRRGPLARRRHGGGLARARGRGARPVQHRGGPAAAAGQAAGRPGCSARGRRPRRS